MSNGSVAPFQFSLDLLVSLLAGKLCKVFHCRDFLSSILTLHLLHELNSFNVSVRVVFTSVLERSCPNNIIAVYKVWRQWAKQKIQWWYLCPVSSEIRDSWPLSFLSAKRTKVCTITVNISRGGWSLSSFYCWNMVLNMVFCRGVSNGRMPSYFFFSVLYFCLCCRQLAHPSPYSPSAASMVCLPNESIHTQSWSL